MIVTPENGNPNKEKGEISNPSPNLRTIQPKEQPLTELDVSGRKPTGKRQENLYLFLIKPLI